VALGWLHFQRKGPSKGLLHIFTSRFEGKIGNFMILLDAGQGQGKL
jgi:hypothetical protein